MEVYCTRPLQPNEAPHQNSIPENLVAAAFNDDEVMRQLQCLRCETCQMPLVLDHARYVPIEEIGQGGFGRVFLVLDRRFNLRKRALKQLRREFFLLDGQLKWAEEKFRQEADVLDGLNHPHIPRIYPSFIELADPDPRFKAQLPEPQRFFYLAQSYVDGLDLQRSLQQQKLPFQEAEVVKLLKDLLGVLEYIHSKGIIHRDVKPSNIICASDGSYNLIDFGTVKVFQLAEEFQSSSQPGTVLLSKGFSAPEMIKGEAYAQSDLYSLAATCVSLLTCKNPKEFGIPDQLDTWHKQTKVSPKLVKTLNQMLQRDYQKRYKTAAEVLQTLNPPWFPVWQKLVFASGVGVLGLFGWMLWQSNHATSGPISTSDLPHYLSRGRESLMVDNQTFPQGSLCEQAFAGKQEGVDAFAKGDYKRASEQFKQALEKFKQARQGFVVPAIDQSAPSNAQTAPVTCGTDPETVVFWNNTKAILRGNPLTIAVSLPLGDPAWRGAANEMLTGVAQVQQDFNSTAANNRLLQVMLTRDNNDGKVSTQIAQLLMNNQIPADASNSSNDSMTEVLGVIGHLSSVATQSAGKVYGSQNLPLISPASTAVRTAENFSPVVFRTATTDAIAGQDLAIYAKTKQYKTALVIYNQDDFYSQSLKREFSRIFGQQDQSLECDLDTKTAQDCLKQAHRKGADMLLLASGTKQIDKAKDVITINQQRLPILAGDALYSGELLGSVGPAAEGMVVAVAWHRDLADDQFKKTLIDLWGTSSVSWRVGTTYDATIALVEASKQAGATPTRQKIYDTLKQSDFSVAGATGSVQFDQAGDRQVFTGLGVLVQVRQEKGLLTFVRQETPRRDESGGK